MSEAQKSYAEMSDSEKKKEDWMNSKWRPMMGWLYMATCTFDFVIFPILWSLLQTVAKQPITQWQPLTLQGAGLYHIAMGAVLGLAAWGRTQEKLNGANNGGAQPAGGFGSPAPSGFGAPAAGGFGAPRPTQSFGSAPLGGNSASTASAFGAGKPAVSTALPPGFGATNKPDFVEEPMPDLPPANARDS